MDPQIPVIVAIWDASGAAHQELWTFYIIVVTAVIGYAYTDTFAKTSHKGRRIIFVILLLFMAVNAYSMWNNLQIYNQSILQLKALAGAPELSTIVSEMSWGVFGEKRYGIPACLVIFFHLILDISVAGVMLPKLKKTTS